MAEIQTRHGKRGKTYRIEFMRDGKRTSKTFKIKKDALLLVSKLNADPDFADTYINQTHITLTFDNAANEYLRQYKGKDDSIFQRLDHWIAVFKSKPVSKIQKKDIKNELRKLQAKGLANATLNRYKAAIGSLYKYLDKEHDISHNPTKDIPQFTEDNARTRFLSDDEVSRLLEATKQSNWLQLHLLVLMALTTGARRGELTGLTWQNIDLGKRTAHLKDTKNKEQRVLTLPHNLVEELMKFRRSTGYVFLHPDSDVHKIGNFDCYWRASLKLAGISDFRFHDLRHTCASMLAMKGASVLEIAEVLGHKSITMTQRYAHLCTNHKAKLTDRVFGQLNQVI